MNSSTSRSGPTWWVEMNPRPTGRKAAARCRSDARAWRAQTRCCRQHEDLAEHVRILLVADMKPITRRPVARSITSEALAHDLLKLDPLLDHGAASTAFEQRRLDLIEAAAQEADDEIVVVATSPLPPFRRQNEAELIVRRAGVTLVRSRHARPRARGPRSPRMRERGVPAESGACAQSGHIGSPSGRSRSPARAGSPSAPPERAEAEAPGERGAEVVAYVVDAEQLMVDEALDGAERTPIRSAACGFRCGRTEAVKRFAGRRPA
jgi:hypothetical protein